MIRRNYIAVISSVPHVCARRTPKLRHAVPSSASTSASPHGTTTPAPVLRPAGAVPQMDPPPNVRRDCPAAGLSHPTPGRRQRIQNRVAVYSVVYPSAFGPLGLGVTPSWRRPHRRSYRPRAPSRPRPARCATATYTRTRSPPPAVAPPPLQAAPVAARWRAGGRRPRRRPLAAANRRWSATLGGLRRRWRSCRCDESVERFTAFSAPLPPPLLCFPQKICAHTQSQPLTSVGTRSLRGHTQQLPAQRSCTLPCSSLRLCAVCQGGTEQRGAAA